MKIPKWRSSWHSSSSIIIRLDAVIMAPQKKFLGFEEENCIIADTLNTWLLSLFNVQHTFVYGLGIDQIPRQCTARYRRTEHGLAAARGYFYFAVVALMISPAREHIERGDVIAATLTRDHSSRVEGALVHLSLYTPDWLTGQSVAVSL